MVETALLMPLILLLVFGVIEFSFAFQSSAVLADATRAAGRAGSAVGGEPDYVETIDQVASAALQRVPSGASPEYMIVYQANTAGFPGGEGDLSVDVYESCAGDGYGDTCVALEWNGDDFTVTGGAWDPATHERCEQPFDRIGVGIFMSFEPLTSLFAPVLEREVDGDPADPMIDHAVFVFEPLPQDDCA